MNSEAQTKLIACQVGELTIGIDLARIQEVNRLVKATFVPGIGAEVCGLINLRGSLVTVLDLGHILLGQPIEPGTKTRTVIIESGGERFGILVDSVGGVMHGEASVEDLPTHIGSHDAKWFTGLVQVENDVMLILDLDAVLGTGAEEIEST